MLSPKILCCHHDTWFHLNLLFSNPEVTSTFSLSYVNETMYLLWNVPFFKMAPPKTFFLFSNLGLIVAQQTSIHANCFMTEAHILCHSISKLHIMGERTW